MATQCGDILTKEIQEQLSEANEEEQRWAESGTSDRLAEEYSKVANDLEAASEDRAVELLKGNIVAGLNSLPEDFFRSSGENNILKLDAEAIPTDQECRESYRLWQQVGAERYEASNFPVMMGISDPETLERMPDIKEIVKDEMGRLYHSKLSPWFRDSEVVDRIILVDKDAGDKKGATLKQEQLTKDVTLSRVAHVFRDPTTGKMYEGDHLHWAIIHEIVHLNLDKGRDDKGERDFRGIFHVQHREEWINASYSQIGRMEPVSDYAQNAISKSGMPGLDETEFTDPEFIAECVSAWDTNPEKICPEMLAFLDKYLS